MLAIKIKNFISEKVLLLLLSFSFSILEFKK